MFHRSKQQQPPPPHSYTHRIACSFFFHQTFTQTLIFFISFVHSKMKKKKKAKKKTEAICYVSAKIALLHNNGSQNAELWNIIKNNCVLKHFWMVVVFLFFLPPWKLLTLMRFVVQSSHQWRQYFAWCFTSDLQSSACLFVYNISLRVGPEY